MECFKAGEGGNAEWFAEGCSLRLQRMLDQWLLTSPMCKTSHQLDVYVYVYVFVSMCLYKFGL